MAQPIPSPTICNLVEEMIDLLDHPKVKEHQEAHPHYPRDDRNGGAWYVFAEKPTFCSSFWHITPQGPKDTYRITVATNDDKTRNWPLTVHRYYDKDKRSETSTYACIHVPNGNEGQCLWTIKPE